MIVKCSICTKNLERDSYSIKRTKKFYCKECLKNRKKYVVVKCHNCNLSFNVEPYKIKTQKNFKCSICRPKTLLYTKFCNFCGKEYLGTKCSKYCSKLCKSTLLRKKYEQTDKYKEYLFKKRAQPTLKTCSICKKEFYSIGNKKYCTRKCFTHFFNKKYRKENYNQLTLLKKEYYKINGELIRDKIHKYYKQNCEKIKHYKKTYRKMNPEKTKEIAIKNTYNLSLDEYKLIWKNQNYRCKICKKNISILKKNDKKISACIDHDHKTGKVRGLLCSSCNFGLGMFKDNINNLKKAILYLTDSKN